MSIYAIGDVQGCFDELQDLLALIQYQADRDQLWFTGDLVNRGSQSLAVLRFIKNLKNSVVVLGNHDLHLLALSQGNSYSNHSLTEVLTAPDSQELITWLRQQPLMHYDPALDYVMVHAGLVPQWDLAKAQACAREVEQVLRDDVLYPQLVEKMYGDEPSLWDDALSSWDRWRFIINVFTRIRFCDREGRLDLHCKGRIGSQPEGYLPWFKVPHRLNKNLNVIFGHWAALEGETGEPKVFALDTGCAWGNYLTAMRLEDQQRFHVRSKTTKLKG